MTGRLRVGAACVFLLSACAALGACATPSSSSSESSEVTGEDRAALMTGAPAWVVYPGGPENDFRNSLNVAVGTPVKMVPVHGGGKPTRYELRSLAHIYGGSSALPRGLTFDSSTGILAGAAAEPTNGVSFFSVTASNELGVAEGSAGWGTQRILRVNVVLASTPITNGWYLTDAWDHVYRDTAEAMIAAAPELLRAQRLRTFGDWVTYSVDWQGPVSTPAAPASRRVGFAGRMLWSDGREWPYNNIAADLWCNGNATTNIQVSTAGEISIADPSFVAAAPLGECLCPADTSWNPLARDGKGNCERQLDCKITTTECPNFPDYTGTFSDVPDYWTDSINGAADPRGHCASRAKAWRDRCGTEAPVKSEYVVNGKVQATTVEPPPPPPGGWLFNGSCGNAELGSCANIARECPVTPALDRDCDTLLDRCLGAPDAAGIRKKFVCTPRKKTVWAFNGYCDGPPGTPCVTSPTRPECAADAPAATACDAPGGRCVKGTKVFVCLPSTGPVQVASALCGDPVRGQRSCDEFPMPACTAAAPAATSCDPVAVPKCKVTTPDGAIGKIFSCVQH